MGKRIPDKSHNTCGGLKVGIREKCGGRGAVMVVEIDSFILS